MVPQQHIIIDGEGPCTSMQGHRRLSVQSLEGDHLARARDDTTAATSSSGRRQVRRSTIRLFVILSVLVMLIVAIIDFVVTGSVEVSVMLGSVVGVGYICALYYCVATRWARCRSQRETNGDLRAQLTDVYSTPVHHVAQHKKVATDAARESTTSTQGRTPNSSELLAQPQPELEPPQTEPKLCAAKKPEPTTQMERTHNSEILLQPEPEPETVHLGPQSESLQLEPPEPISTLDIPFTRASRLQLVGTANPDHVTDTRHNDVSDQNNTGDRFRHDCFAHFTFTCLQRTATCSMVSAVLMGVMWYILYVAELVPLNQSLAWFTFVVIASFVSATGILLLVLLYGSCGWMCDRYGGLCTRESAMCRTWTAQNTRNCLLVLTVVLVCAFVAVYNRGRNGGSDKFWFWFYAIGLSALMFGCAQIYISWGCTQHGRTARAHATGIADRSTAPLPEQDLRARPTGAYTHRRNVTTDAARESTTTTQGRTLNSSESSSESSLESSSEILAQPQPELEPPQTEPKLCAANRSKPTTQMERTHNSEILLQPEPEPETLQLEPPELISMLDASFARAPLDTANYAHFTNQNQKIFLDASLEVLEDRKAAAERRSRHQQNILDQELLLSRLRNMRHGGWLTQMLAQYEQYFGLQPALGVSRAAGPSSWSLLVLMATCIVLFVFFLLAGWMWDPDIKTLGDLLSSNWMLWSLIAMLPFLTFSAYLVCSRKCTANLETKVDSNTAMSGSQCTGVVKNSQADTSRLRTPLLEGIAPVRASADFAVVHSNDAFGIKPRCKCVCYLLTVPLLPCIAAVAWLCVASVNGLAAPHTFFKFDSEDGEFWEVLVASLAFTSYTIYFITLFLGCVVATGNTHITTFVWQLARRCDRSNRRNRARNCGLIFCPVNYAEKIASEIASEIGSVSRSGWCKYFGLITLIVYLPVRLLLVTIEQAAECISRCCGPCFYGIPNRPGEMIPQGFVPKDLEQPQICAAIKIRLNFVHQIVRIGRRIVVLLLVIPYMIVGAVLLIGMWVVTTRNFCGSDAKAYRPCHWSEVSRFGWSLGSNLSTSIALAYVPGGLLLGPAFVVAFIGFISPFMCFALAQDLTNVATELADDCGHHGCTFDDYWDRVKFRFGTSILVNALFVYGPFAATSLYVIVATICFRWPLYRYHESRAAQFAAKYTKVLLNLWCLNCIKSAVMLIGASIQLSNDNWDLVTFRFGASIWGNIVFSYIPFPATCIAAWIYSITKATERSQTAKIGGTIIIVSWWLLYLVMCAVLLCGLAIASIFHSVRWDEISWRLGPSLELNIAFVYVGPWFVHILVHIWVCKRSNWSSFFKNILSIAHHLLLEPFSLQVAEGQAFCANQTVDMARNASAESDRQFEAAVTALGPRQNVLDLSNALEHQQRVIDNLGPDVMRVTKTVSDTTFGLVKGMMGNGLGFAPELLAESVDSVMAGSLQDQLESELGLDGQYVPSIPVVPDVTGRLAKVENEIDDGHVTAESHLHQPSQQGQLE